MEKQAAVCIVLLTGGAFWLGACASSPPVPAVTATQAPTKTLTATAVPLSPTSPQSETLGGFPFPVGATWVYSRVQYEPRIGDPTQIMTATNLITETVVRTEGTAPNQEFVHRQTASLVSAPPSWQDNSSNFNWERWYRIDGTSVFSSPDGNRQTSTLVYNMPLIVGKSWCPQQPPAANPNCVSMGKRTVRDRTTYSTPAGSFDECYEVSEDYNSGGVTEWFCTGIGVVARKYDHGGTRFGFGDTLIRFSMGTPSP